MGKISELLNLAAQAGRHAVKVYRREGFKGLKKRARRWRKSWKSPNPSSALAGEYASQIFGLSLAAQWGYVPAGAGSIDLAPDDIKLIAFYLPQFHPVPENDIWWGRGFTEWTNVTRAVPQYLGHNQPKLPGDLGFYDLRLIDTQRAQIQLAKKYGVFGFCYYHYWFSGRRILEKPLNQMLANPDLDLPFCLCWANGNWTRAWDGSEREILLEQTHSPTDDIAFLESLFPVFADSRYIRIGGRPLLLIYWPSLMADPAATAARWRKRAREAGVDEPYLVFPLSHDSMDPRSIGFDAAVEFPPVKKMEKGRSRSVVQIVNPEFGGEVHDYRQRVAAAENFVAPAYRVFRGVMPAWDNESRRPGRGIGFSHATPELYRRWLGNICRETRKRLPSQERLVFINAWNEWAEGAYLEPDRRNGYAFLKATADAISDSRVPTAGPGSSPLGDKSVGKDIALIFHVSNMFAWKAVGQYLNRMVQNWELFVSVPSLDIALHKCIQDVCPAAKIFPVADPGNGGDAFAQIYPAVLQGRYRYVCKCPDTPSGKSADEIKLWEQKLDNLLFSDARISRIKKAFDGIEDLGILAQTTGPLGSQPSWSANMKLLIRLACALGVPVNPLKDLFPKDSMFWFRPQAIEPLLRLRLTSEDFAFYAGSNSGDLSVALNWAFPLIAQASGYCMSDLTETIGEVG